MKLGIKVINRNELVFLVILFILIAGWLLLQERPLTIPTPPLLTCEKDSDCGWGTIQGDPMEIGCILGGVTDESPHGLKCICNKNYTPPKCEEQEIAEQVTITTDKTEYEQGEIVKMTVNNGLDKSIYYSYPQLGIERFDNGNWTQIKMVLAGCGVPGGFPYGALSPNAKDELQWDQKEKWCSNPDPSVISDLISKQVLAGKYRIKSEIFDQNTPENKQTIYSNEFTIKEKDETAGCKNLCGDGVCQEIVCMAIGCPCAETKESCSHDCK